MIKEILNNELVVTNLNFNCWEDVIRYNGELLLNKNKIKKEFIKSSIDIVYKFVPYMILLPKVCFFHGEPGGKVIETCMSLTVFKNSIYFKECENQEIKCAFLFGAKDNESHLEILKNLVTLLNDEQFVKLIINNGDKAEIMRLINKY